MSVTVPLVVALPPQPEHVTLLFKSVCESLLLAVPRAGWFLGCASFLGRLSLPQPPTLPLHWASGLLRGSHRGYPAFRGTPGSPSIAQADLRNPATRGQGVFAACRSVLSQELVGMGWGLHFPQFRSGPATLPSPRWSAQRGQAPGERRRSPGMRTAGAMCV